MEVLNNVKALAESQKRYVLANGECTSDLENLDVTMPPSSEWQYQCWIDSAKQTCGCVANRPVDKVGFEFYASNEGKTCFAPEEQGYEICRLITGKKDPDRVGNPNSFWDL